AVEYFLQEKLKSKADFKKLIPFIHFAATSEDINSTAYALMINTATGEELIPTVTEIIDALDDLAHTHSTTAMLSRTHGQPASPTTVGKEMANYVMRLQGILERLEEVRVPAKFSGAVGNFNAHVVAYPEIDWSDAMQEFLSGINVPANHFTTQIEPHDRLAEVMNLISQINTVLLDFARDVWGYIALEYFKQKTISTETGSSTMPHKVNPIDFENAEGNFGLANALATHFASKLPISRWQRDLTDSTVLRNVGMTFGYSHIAYTSLLKGINKLEVNTKKLQQDLANNPMILAEPIQTVMRRYGINDAYEQLKQLTRGNTVGEGEIREFIKGLDIPDDAKQRLLELSPGTYVGIAGRLVDRG
ncbi:MAG: adenylosuccinate lyase, partial [Legionellales bacterium]